VLRASWLGVSRISGVCVVEDILRKGQKTMEKPKPQFQLLEGELIRGGLGIAKCWAKVRSGEFIVRVTLFERYNFSTQETESWVGLPRREKSEKLPNGKPIYMAEVELIGLKAEKELLLQMKAMYRRLHEDQASKAQKGSKGYRDLEKSAKTELEVEDLKMGINKRVEGGINGVIGTRAFVPDTAPPGGSLQE
jgi:hypothetical protein